MHDEELATKKTERRGQRQGSVRGRGQPEKLCAAGARAHLNARPVTFRAADRVGWYDCPYFRPEVRLREVKPLTLSHRACYWERTSGQWNPRVQVSGNLMMGSRHH